MTMSNGFRKIEFGGPSNYRIVVQGTLSADWSDRLAGLAIIIVDENSDSPRTTLVGPIRDQAELNGVLDTLYGLHMTILAVERAEDED